ncbi:hypothetical protein BASA50_010762 [Batrachochytrium salamandrivorans]|uniref:EB1 C-terminal domain-containing protein n=1 Tax=Batrachochytrium salamandrivorans TaxID=1357716 RepID=A0ABQ8EXP4_9FUNG|nr:hypothetical protein BASA62_006467 [Batrachochytrium salamandrivorans]KAH6575965.1 hypothetical protein BASA60_004735 [Batrachochytrium salamandrivorans]KAH6583558.1 hypothetical protein BASA61_007944 [Batrachochytrium salamandrivorans]KAH6588396.1 hypothetical protein BASA50_010762 [Batrachochytrium salamandrivorans]KAH9269736.1 hypothetical protein BASA83_008208 [Batrachochytrium salamandrivorans]
MSESRTELLSWLNDLCQVNHTKIEQCGSGVAHCVIMDSIYRDVPMSKIKFNAKHEYEYVANFKVLQSVFDKHKIDNAIPVERLMKCKFQDNLEFMQWMKKYWDQYYPGGAYDAMSRRKGEVVGGGSSMRSNPAKAPSPHISSTTSASSVKKSMSNSSMSAMSKANIPPSAATAASRKASAPPRAAAAAGPIHGGSDAERAQFVAEYQQMKTDMSIQIEELKVTVDQVEKEREFYFSKLREIELYIQTRTETGIDDHLDEAFKEIQGIMYKTEEGFEIPENAEESTF